VKLEKAFGKWKPTEVKPMPKPELSRPGGLTIHLVDRPGSVQSNIIIARLGPARDNANVPELQLLNTTLGGGMTSRLFANLREKHGYTYGAYSAFSFKKQAGAFFASAEVRNEVTAPAITEMLRELSRISAEQIPSEELDIQRQYMVGNFLLSLEDPAITAQRVQDIEFYGLPENYYGTLAQRVMAVTPEKELELAAKYLGKDDYTIVVVGDASHIRKSLEKLGKVVVYDTDLIRKEQSEKD
jgi:zinc protease